MGLRLHVLKPCAVLVMMPTPPNTLAYCRGNRMEDDGGNWHRPKGASSRRWGNEDNSGLRGALAPSQNTLPLCLQ